MLSESRKSTSTKHTKYFGRNKPHSLFLASLDTEWNKMATSSTDGQTVGQSTGV